MAAMVEASALGRFAPHELRNALVVVLVSVVVFAVVAMVRKLLWQPLTMRRIMIKQGVAAAPFHFLVGSLPECLAYAAQFSGDLHVDDHYDSTPTVSPMNVLYFPKNEKFFLYEWGSEPRLASRDPEFAKEVLLTSRAGDFGKARMNSLILEMVLGPDSVAVIQDVSRHDKHRQILNPFFYTEGLKTMVDSMVEGALPTIQSWEKKVALGGGVADFDVLQDLHEIAGKVISLAAFTNDYEKGRKMYDNQMKLVSIVFKSLKNPLFWAPGYRLLPTSTNREMARLKKETQSLLDDIVGARRKAAAGGSEGSYGTDLLGHMLHAAEGKGASAEFNMNSVFRNAEALYFAGQDTVANALGFALLMLARHPEWQQRARREAAEVCGSPTATIDAAKLTRLKTMGMVINETMRLFVVLPKVAREAKRDVWIGDLFIPKGMTVEISLQAMHLDSAYWGDDVFKFNPDRFANGVSKACTHPQAFLPFSTGPNFCIGNNFAVMELKVALAMALQRFQILVSPDYKHHPHLHLVQRPRYGLPLVLKAL